MITFLVKKIVLLSLTYFKESDILKTHFFYSEGENIKGQNVSLRML